MDIKGINKICINLLMGVVVFIVLYCGNFAISWLKNFEYTDMLFVTLPFLMLGICCAAVFGFAADYAEEKRQRELRKKKRNFVLKNAYRNRNKIVLHGNVVKNELFIWKGAYKFKNYFI